MRPVAQHKQTGLFTLQKFLDDARRSAETTRENIFHCCHSVIQRHGNSHTLASRQTIRLDHNRRTGFRQIGQRCNFIIKALIVSRGNIVGATNILGETL